MLHMKRLGAMLAVTLLAALPAGAETGTDKSVDGGVEEGFSLLEEGAKIIMREMLDEMEPALDEMQKGLGTALKEWEPALRDLATRVGDLSRYHAPEMLPNGDIIIRRKREPMGPELPGADPMGPNGEIEL